MIINEIKKATDHSISSQVREGYKRQEFSDAHSVVSENVKVGFSFGTHCSRLRAGA